MKIRLLALTLAGIGLPALLWAQPPAPDSTRDAKRAEEWKTPEIFRALQVQRGSRIADIGCGDGFLTFRLASAVGPDGRVFAVDIVDRVLNILKRRIEDDGARNIEVIKGEEGDPRLAPRSLDGAVILRAYHEFAHYREMLAAIRTALRPGGRIVIADVGPAGADLDRSSQVSRHVLSPRLVEKDLIEAGFRIVASEPQFARIGSHETAWLIAAEPGTRARDIHSWMAPDRARLREKLPCVYCW